jgi:amidohydrolase
MTKVDRNNMDDQQILEELSNLRRSIHQHPETAGEEKETADKIHHFLSKFEPDRIKTGIGGTGLIAEYDSGKKGPTVLFRCELDGLPIKETGNVSHRSHNIGKGHLCGHDGHMTMVTGLAYHLQKQKPKKGRVLLLYQPSEETGQGAKKIIEDKKFKEFEPDFVFALHNLPGYPLHKVILSRDRFAAASRGMKIQLKGKSSHAAEPENGINPGYGMAKMLIDFHKVLNTKNLFSDFVLFTPIHLRLGNLAYGTSPGDGVIHLTLRSYHDQDMKTLSKKLEKIAHDIATKEKLGIDISYEEVFPATVNNSDCTDIIKNVSDELEIKNDYLKTPFKWSEDFGHFTSRYQGAFFGLGSGIDQPALHNPDFDFPDDLIPTGINLFKGIYKRILDH